MKKIHLSKCSKMCAWLLTGVGAVLLTSCAGDGFSDESFVPGNGVTNTKLTTPSGDDIKIEASSDGSKQTISWPIVYGAGGYKAVLTNLSTNEVLVDSIIDNLTFAASREEDTNYKLTLQVLGNTKLGNTDGDVVDKPFSTFTASYAKIPVGDLYAYFQNNPIPDDQTDELNYDLEAGGQYTLSAPLEFNFHKVCLRSTDKGNPATITVAPEANFVVSNSFSLKYLNVAMTAIPENAKPVLELFKYEGDTALDGILEKPKNYYLIPTVNLIGCKFTNVIGSLIFDNNKAYCIMSLNLKKTMVQLNTTKEKIRNEAFISFQGGGVKDIVFENTTFYQTGSENFKYFLRYNNSVRADRITGSKTDFTTFNYTNNTFFRICDTKDGQWFNSNGPKDYSIYTVFNNIWVDCTSGQIARRIKGNSQLGTSSQARFLHNTYWLNGAAYDQAEHDASGTVLTTDPAFEDAANGDFTPTGAEQVQYKTGDSRWYE